MYYLGDMGKYIYADCECGHTNKIPKEFCNKREGKSPEYDLTQPVKCEKCGIETNQIIQKTKVKKGFWQNVKEGFHEMEQHEETKKAIKEAEAQEPIRCPKCGSTQITANKKGFNIGKAVVGDLAVGAVGLLAGGIGKDKVIITCLNCGYKWKAGKRK